MLLLVLSVHTMKRILPLLLVPLGLLLGGCLVESVFPFYLDSDVTYQPKLEGDWVEKKDSGEPDELWRFKKRENGYWFKAGNTNLTEVGHEGPAHLFRLADAELLDLEFDLFDKHPQAVPFHLLLKVEQWEPTLKVSLLDDDCLKDVLGKNPTLLQLPDLRDESGKPDHGAVRLAATTPDLRRFLLEHLKDKGMFGATGEYRRPAK